MKQPGKRNFICVLSLLFFAGMATLAPAAGDTLAWPALASQTRPWTYWWWMGSAVDKTNLTRELQRYHDAGLGGVHIIPIYGAKGWESNYISHLSPKWMAMLGYTVSEAHRLGLGVDMTTGTGWCFGGPQVSDQDANANVVVKTYDLGVGERLKEKFKRESIQALVAFGPDGKSIDLTASISTNGQVFFSPPGNRVGTETSAPPKTWRVYAISQKPSGQKVKRAAPGGAGWMLNPFYPPAMSDYLRRFTDAFANYDGPKPRAQYQDSYEYKSDWAPDFFAQFEKRRGYKLQTELPALFGTNQDDHAARVQSDYRETISDIMVEESEPRWIKWSHEHGFITRYEAHGSPGNLLDLYAVADIPETEFFRTNRNPLVSKFASSAAHLRGDNLVAAETGTWLAEHFTETLGEMKSLVDEMFLSGVNHIFYHGTCYSPDEAGWPGWLFYASTEMNPRNSIWRDAPALNDYIARCQSILQSGKPDNDVLLYWPVYDYWNEATNRLPTLQVESQQIWFENQPIGKTAHELWNRGYAFDYVSDRQLQTAKVTDGKIQMPGGNYKVIVVPPCGHLPLKTGQKLLALARSGATVIFQDDFPTDVPGWGNLEKQRAEYKNAMVNLERSHPASLLEQTKVGRGQIFVGRIGMALSLGGATREPMTDNSLLFVRRTFDGGYCYFIAHRGDKRFDGWVTLACAAKSAVILDPMNGSVGIAALNQTSGQAQVYLQLQPGESVMLRVFANRKIDGPAWNYWRPAGPGGEIKGGWQVEFISGGPTLPAPLETTKLASWTEQGDTNAQSFAGTTRYSITFDAPDPHSGPWQLDLGDVRQSARVQLNSRDYGTLITPPFRVTVDNLKPAGNQLEVEVTGVSANRIRDLDRRGVPWKNFRDINFVDIDYKPFNAANWPLIDSGLLGPVTLTAVAPVQVR
ncbi:MAG: glycosyl hydrolase [Verrucomicrobiota bacterium]